MPVLLSESHRTEQNLLAEVVENPLNTDLVSVLADHAGDQGEGNREMLLRETPLAFLEYLRDSRLTEEECQQVLQAPTADLQRTISNLLGTPQRGDAMLSLLTPERLLDLQNLRLQYDLQRTLRASLGLPVGPDRFAQIQDRLSTSAHLHEAVEQGRTLLLEVPRRPLSLYITAWEQGLRRNAHLFSGRLNKEPVWLSDRYKPESESYEPLEYHHPSIDGPSGDTWLSEEQWTAERDSDFLFVRPDLNLPSADCNRTPDQSYAQRSPRQRFLTPQAYIILFLTLLELRGEVPDRRTFSFLLGARFAPSRVAPGGGWVPYDVRARLGWDRRVARYERAGPRVASEVD